MKLYHKKLESALNSAINALDWKLTWDQWKQSFSDFDVILKLEKVQKEEDLGFNDITLGRETLIYEEIEISLTVYNSSQSDTYSLSFDHESILDELNYPIGFSHPDPNDFKVSSPKIRVGKGSFTI